MSLFSDLYGTLAKFFRSSEDPDASKAVATNRLKLVLMQDRTNLTPKILEQMRGEMIELLSKYLEMDKDLLELNFEQEGDQVALMLSIPVIRAKDEEEIEAALKAAKEKLQKTEESAEEESSTEDDSVESDSEAEASDESDEEDSDDEEDDDDEGEELEEREYFRVVEPESTSEKESSLDSQRPRHRQRKLRKFVSPQNLASGEIISKAKTEDEFEGSEV